MEIKKQLISHNKKVTPERVKLFEKMQSLHIFQSKDIIEAFPDIGRASIFRTLKLFGEIGVLRRVHLGAYGESYEIECCKKCHHEHMKCHSCGEILSFDSHDVCSKIFAEAEKIGFHIHEHCINIFGVCKRCQG